MKGRTFLRDFPSSSASSSLARPLLVLPHHPYFAQHCFLYQRPSRICSSHTQAERTSLEVFSPSIFAFLSIFGIIPLFIFISGPLLLIVLSALLWCESWDTPKCKALCKKKQEESRHTHYSSLATRRLKFLATYESEASRMKSFVSSLPLDTPTVRGHKLR